MAHTSVEVMKSLTGKAGRGQSIKTPVTSFPRIQAPSDYLLGLRFISECADAGTSFQAGFPREKKTLTALLWSFKERERQTLSAE